MAGRIDRQPWPRRLAWPPAGGIDRRRYWRCLVWGFALGWVGGAAADDRILLEIHTEPERPYVQARIIYAARVLARVPLRQATLSDPAVADVGVQRLGEDRHWQEVRDGQRYSVLERRWALLARAPGELVIAGPRLHVAVPRPSAEAGVIERLETLTLTGAPVTIAVQPIPAAAEAPWLPAEAVSISEEWRPDVAELHVGTPVTRTLRLTAMGAGVAQLPELVVPAGEGFKVYAEPPQLAETASGGDLVATLTVQATYVPLAAGVARVPELRLPWWNLGLAAPAQVHLGARQWRVMGPVAPAEPPPGQAPAAASHGASDDLWRGPWPALLFALIGWIAFLRCRRHAPATAATPMSAAQGEGAAWRRVERACRDGDAAAARAALLDWGVLRWPRAAPRGLDALCERLGADPDTLALARGLDAHLYGRTGGPWDGQTLLRALRPWSRDSAGAIGAAGGLPPLYPSGR